MTHLYKNTLLEAIARMRLAPNRQHTDSAGSLESDELEYHDHKKDQLTFAAC